MKNNIIILFSICLVYLFSENCRAGDVFDLLPVKPILNPLYPAVPELNLSLTYVPVGAFNKHLGLGGSYLNYVNSNHAWEVISAHYFVEIPSSLKKVLVDSYGASENNFAILQYMIKSGYLWTPFYSKSILFNSTLIHSRTFLGMSGGIASYKIETPLVGAISFGQNFYFGDRKAFKMAVEYLHFFKKNNYIQDQLTISLGLVFNWGER